MSLSILPTASLSISLIPESITMTIFSEPERNFMFDCERVMSIHSLTADSTLGCSRVSIGGTEAGTQVSVVAK